MPTSPRAEWMHRARFGLFLHYLADVPSQTSLVAMDAATWNRQVDAVDVETLARRIADAGVPYVYITLGQNSGWYCAPNPVYDDLVGHRESHCSRRDLPGDLGRALAARGVKLCLYAPVHGPNNDAHAVARLGCTLEIFNNRDPAQFELRRQRSFIRSWQRVLGWWGDHYGEQAKAWWIDGPYFNEDMFHHADEPNFTSFAAALRQGNPQRCVAFNPGVINPVISVDAEEDYTAGEINDPLDVVCPGRWVGQAQYHVLSYLGTWWRGGPPRFTDAQVSAMTAGIVQAGGVITWDAPIDAAGIMPDWALRQLARTVRDLDRGLPIPEIQHRRPGSRPRLRTQLRPDPEARPRHGILRVRVDNPGQERMHTHLDITAEGPLQLGYWGPGVLVEPADHSQVEVPVSWSGDAVIAHVTLRGNPWSSCRCELRDVGVARADASGRWSFPANDAQGQAVGNVTLQRDGTTLLVRVQVIDPSPARGSLPWEHSGVELFLCPALGGGISQVFLLPDTDGRPAVIRLQPGCGVASIGSSITSAHTTDGWRLEARLPLNGDLVGDELRVEAYCNSHAADGSRRQGTLFGSREAHRLDARFALLVA